ncbi:MAG: hypothetical protein HOQ24_09410 [Mycobacteriaceae bacterium]|nr:hypothetical protein [Mycobacteriaceae bacterium]
MTGSRKILRTAVAAAVLTGAAAFATTQQAAAEPPHKVVGNVSLRAWEENGRTTEIHGYMQGTYTAPIRGHVDIWGPGINPPSVGPTMNSPVHSARTNGRVGRFCVRGWSYDGAYWHDEGTACVVTER